MGAFTRSPRYPGSDAELGAGDGGDHVLAADAAHVERGRAPAQAQDDDPVGDGEDVLEVVADDHDAEPALAQGRG